MTAENVPRAESHGAKVLMNCQVSLSMTAFNSRVGAMVAKEHECRNVTMGRIENPKQRHSGPGYSPDEDGRLFGSSLLGK